MEINYIITKTGKKLFSFHNHHYNSEDGVAIDGGFSSYIRVIGDAELKKDSISSLIEDIRNQFTWGQNYDKDGNRLSQTKIALLKDLDSNHILGILKYFTERADKYPNEHIGKEWLAIHLIFIEELLYRNKLNTGTQSE